jgi:hypothetical protein
MTVKQLIEMLQTFPQDLPVYLADWSEGCAADIPLGAGLQLLPFVAEAAQVGVSRNRTLPKRVVIGAMPWNRPVTVD